MNDHQIGKQHIFASPHNSDVTFNISGLNVNDEFAGCRKCGWTKPFVAGEIFVFACGNCGGTTKSYRVTKDDLK